MYNDFAERFKEACKRHPKAPRAQEALGKFFGVSGTTVFNWRNGRKLPSTKMGQIIAEKLGVSFDYLMTGHSSPSERVSGYTIPDRATIQTVNRQVTALCDYLEIDLVGGSEAEQVDVDIFKHHIAKLIIEEPGAADLPPHMLWRLIKDDL